MAARHVESNLAVLAILIASLLLFANPVPASGADPQPPPCKTAAQFDPANFPNLPKLDNQWNPLAPGMQLVMADEANRGTGQTHRVVSTVTDLTKVVNGVTASVILETDSNEGVLQSSKLAFRAQDNVGNLWNLGEFPAEFDDNGKFKEAPDTWISGLSNAEQGNLMVSNPQLGTPEYLQGWSPDIDFFVCAKVYKVQQKTCVPVGCYDNVLITEERSALEPESGHRRKYYAPGVGNVRVDAAGGPEKETIVLAEVSQLNPEDLAKVRREALKLEEIAYMVSALYRQTPALSATLKAGQPARQAPGAPVAPGGRPQRSGPDAPGSPLRIPLPQDGLTNSGEWTFETAKAELETRIAKACGGGQCGIDIKKEPQGSLDPNGRTGCKEVVVDVVPDIKYEDDQGPVLYVSRDGSITLVVELRNKDGGGCDESPEPPSGGESPETPSGGESPEPPSGGESPETATSP